MGGGKETKTEKARLEHIGDYKIKEGGGWKVARDEEKRNVDAGEKEQQIKAGREKFIYIYIVWLFC